MSAMLEEFELLVSAIQNPQTTTLGKRDYIKGQLFGKEVVAVFSRWGKTAAAATSATLINHFKVTKIIFTGVAGALQPQLNIGDIVIGTTLYHHDFDASPIAPKYHIPLIGKDGISSDLELQNQVLKACQSFIPQIAHSINASLIAEFQLHNVQCHRGIIATGDQFVHQKQQQIEILRGIPETLCVEMEGAAVAQICWEHDIPCVVMRTISDKANTNAPLDFPKFIREVARIYAFQIIKNLFMQLDDA